MNSYMIITDYYCRTLHFHLGKEDLQRKLQFEPCFENGNNKGLLLVYRYFPAADILHLRCFLFPSIYSMNHYLAPLHPVFCKESILASIIMIKGICIKTYRFLLV